MDAKSLKTAVIVANFPSLAETFILNQVTGLIDAGVEVDVFSLFKSAEKRVHPDLEKYNLLEKARYFGIPKNYALRACKAMAVFARGPAARRKAFLKALKIYLGKAFFFSGNRRFLPLSLLFCAPVFAGKNYDIIHCHFGPVGSVGVLLKDNFGKFRIITSFYGYDLSSYIKSRGSGAYSELFRKGDLFLALSNDFRNRLADLGCDRNKILVHPLGVDIEKFKPSGRKKTGKELMILTVGRLVEKKGHEYSIRAFAELTGIYDNLKYVIAGDGPLKKELESLVFKLGLENVEFTGALNRDGILKLYGRAEIFVLASVTAGSGDTEGTPTVLLEAQSCGIPVVATEHSGIPEIVDDGASGYLVPEKDAESLAKKTGMLISDEALRIRMGKAGREKVEKSFDIRKLNERLKGIYAETASRRMTG